MSSLTYLQMVGDVSKVGTCVTLVTNCLLIYLTFYHIKNITRAYKFLIFLLAGIGMLFSILETVVHAFMHSFNASFAYFSIDPMFGASKQLRTALVLIYSVIYVVIICLIAIQFVYRYWVMTGSQHVSFFYGWKCLWWFLYIGICAAIWCVSAYLCLPDKFSMEYMRTVLVDSYNSDVEETAGFLIVAYEPIGNVSTVRIKSILCVCGLSSVLIFQYLVMSFCGVKIQAKMKVVMSLTSFKKHRIQGQLFKTLVLQISAPSTFYHLPAFLLFLVPYFDLELSVPSGIMVCFFSLYPAIDSLILMYMVTEYHRCWKKVSTQLLLRILEWLVREQQAEDVTTKT